MGDHQHRFVPGQCLKGLLDLMLVLRVSEGGGLVQHHNGGVLQNGPGQGDALLLPAGEVNAPGAHHRVQPLGQFFQDVIALGGMGGGKHLLPGGIRPGSPDIFQQALLEQPGILKHKGHLPHEGGAVQLPHVCAAYGDAAAVHIPKPGDQAGGGGLAPAGGTHQSHHLSGLDGKTHILQRGPVRAGVGEGHMVKGHGVVRQPLLGLRLLHGLLAQDLIQAADGLVGLHHRLTHIHDAVDHLAAGGGEQGIEDKIHQRGSHIPTGGDEQRRRDQ